MCLKGIQRAVKVSKQYYKSRYFKKGIKFKQNLSYSNYFGFTDQLWHHGDEYGLGKL